jgi:hypothetical protein
MRIIVLFWGHEQELVAIINNIGSICILLGYYYYSVFLEKKNNSTSNNYKYLSSEYIQFMKIVKKKCAIFYNSNRRMLHYPFSTIYSIQTVYH